MKIIFEDPALEELYLTGTTLDKKYKRLQKSVVKAYIKTVNYLRVSRRIEDLYRINSLHYSKKTGDRSGQEFVRINDKYRLRLKSLPNSEGIFVFIS